jgi:hypothetical protein
MYNVNDNSVLYDNAVGPVIGEGWHFRCGKHLHGRIISLRGDKIQIMNI